MWLWLDENIKKDEHGYAEDRLYRVATSGLQNKDYTGCPSTQGTYLYFWIPKKERNGVRNSNTKNFWSV